MADGINIESPDELDISRVWEADASSTGRTGQPSESEPAIAGRETRTILGIKILFVFVLCLSAAGALGVYFYISARENSEFEAQFSDDATKVLAAIGATIDFSLGTADAFVASIISTAKATNQTFPFVTVPDWPSRAGKIQSLTGALFVTTYMYVEDHQRKQWEDYTSYNNDWVMETVEAQASDPSNELNNTVAYWYENWDVIHGYDEYDKETPGEFGTNRTGPHMVWWQCVPVLTSDPVYNWDLFTDWPLTNCTEWNETEAGEPCNELSTSEDVVVKTHRAAFSSAYMILSPDASEDEKEFIQNEADWLSLYLPPDEDPMEPVSDLYYPILPSGIDTYNQNSDETFDPLNQTFAGMLAMTFFWRDTIRDILPTGSDGIITVFKNPCNPTFTYQINGPVVEYLGSGDHHDTQYDHLELSSSIIDLKDYTIKGSSYTGIPVDKDFCPWSLHIFPSDTMKSQYTSTNATIFTTTAAVVFLLTSIVFCIYDRWVERRQEVVMQTAVQTRDIVSSLFPSNVRARLYSSAKEAVSVAKVTKPVADTFAECTVAFIDIVGFTSWSSAREPSQVFTLLESLYGAYDVISQRRGVFKVETIGDSYVCVTGLPIPQKNHASIMVRFSSDVRAEMSTLVKRLELELGPGTADLTCRVGLHSGPVTAGVLRGQKARFQLFGDTVNTAARMESHGVPNRIHISRKTAEQLRREGKGHWVSERKELVRAKGKGVLKTFFAELCSEGSANSTDVSSSNDSDLLGMDDAQTEIELRQRLIAWNVAMLQDLLKSVVSHRRAKQKTTTPSSAGPVNMADLRANHNGSKMVRDEVLDSIPIPTYEDQKTKRRGKIIDTQPVELDPAVLEQLHKYVVAIEAGYPPNSFHCFEHASHVAMSAKKLLQRVTGGEELSKMDGSLTKESHYETYGIKSDPLIQFAIVFSALVHDVQHPGVANGQLVKEGTEIAKKYQGKSVAEQRSVDIAWDLLMEERFSDLQACIFPDMDEYKRFRQVVINAVVTTDIFDQELKTARERRWEKTYGQEAHTEEELEKDVIDRKATIVIELVIQASDVSHTMQHWHVYQSWNHKLLKEQYTAYKAGRLERNPVESWYGGELWFFDNYIIPLASKMRDCKVFGVSCDEFLDFATDNRLEWASKGKDIVADWAKTLEQDCEDDMKRSKIALQSIHDDSTVDLTEISV